MDYYLLMQSLSACFMYPGLAQAQIWMDVISLRQIPFALRALHIQFRYKSFWAAAASPANIHHFSATIGRRIDGI
jgi:hypothetical protein